jgi:hypothetical protein
MKIDDPLREAVDDRPGKDSCSRNDSDPRAKLAKQFKTTSTCVVNYLKTQAEPFADRLRMD